MSFIETSVLNSEYLWAVVLIFGFPLAMLTLGEVVERWRRRRQRMSAPITHLRFLVLPSLATYLLLTKVVGLASSHTGARLSLTVFLIALIYAVLSVLKAIVFADAIEGSWQRKVPRILTDLIRLSLVVVGSVFVLSAVWGHNLGQMLTALGVGSIVLGLALQEPLGNVFSGIFLLVERPIELGDWVEIDGMEGRVAEINWRSVHLVTRMMELVVVPNSVLAKGQFKNFSRPQGLLCQVAEIGFSYNDPPNEVKSVLESVASQTPGILVEPPAVVYTRGYGDYCINYRIKFYLSEFCRQCDVRDELMTRIWYAARRHGLTIPYPISTEIQATPDDMAASNRPLTTDELAKPLRGLGLSQQSELVRQLEQLSLRSFARGETIVDEGGQLAGLHLIVRGSARMSLIDQTGHRCIIGCLTEGEFFGERALLSSQISDVTIEASEDVEVLVLDGEILQSTLESSPRVAREIGNVIEARKRELRKARLSTSSTSAA